MMSGLGSLRTIVTSRLTTTPESRLLPMRYAFRLLIKSPLFTIVSVLTLAIAI